MTWGQGGSRAWRRTRDKVLTDAHHRCQLQYPGICTGTATEADHTINIASQGVRRLDAVNPKDCQAVCGECHDEKTRRERRAGQLARKRAPTPRHPGLIA